MWPELFSSPVGCIAFQWQSICICQRPIPNDDYIALFLLKKQINECLCFAKYESGVPQLTGHKRKKAYCIYDYKKKDHLQFAGPRERLYINRYKLRCYKRISSPEKSRNNTREKKSYFFTCVWYRQSAADTSLTFRATRSGWLVSGNPFAILSPRSFAGIFLGLWLLKHWKIRITYTHTEWCSNFPNTERKTEY